MNIRMRKSNLPNVPHLYARHYDPEGMGNLGATILMHTRALHATCTMRAASFAALANANVVA